MRLFFINHHHVFTSMCCGFFLYIYSLLFFPFFLAQSLHYHHHHHQNRPNHHFKHIYPNYTHIQSSKLNSIRMTTTNNGKSPVNQVPFTEADLVWYSIILGIMPFGEKIRMGGYVKQCEDSEVAGEAAILPTEEQLKLMLDNLGPGNRLLLNEALDALKSSKSLGKSTKA